MVSFLVSSDDVSKISREFVTNIDGEVDHVPTEAILSLKVGEAFCKIGQYSIFMKTELADQHPAYERAKLVIERSRENYGHKPAPSDQQQPDNESTGDETPKDPEREAFKDFDPDKLF